MTPYGEISYSKSEADIPFVYETAVGTNTSTERVTYTRFYENGVDGKCGIQRFTETLSNGVATATKLEFAYADWAKRADESTVYVPINSCWSL